MLEKLKILDPGGGVDEYLTTLSKGKENLIGAFRGLMREKTSGVYADKYVGRTVPAPKGIGSVPPEARKGCFALPGPGPHVSLLTPEDIREVKGRGETLGSLKKRFSAVDPKGMTVAKKPSVWETKKRKYHVMKVQWPEAQAVRKELGLKPSSFHITVGAQPLKKTGSVLSPEKLYRWHGFVNELDKMAAVGESALRDEALGILGQGVEARRSQLASKEKHQQVRGYVEQAQGRRATREKIAKVRVMKQEDYYPTAFKVEAKQQRQIMKAMKGSGFRMVGGGPLSSGWSAGRSGPRAPQATMGSPYPTMASRMGAMRGAMSGPTGAALAAYGLV